MRLHAVQEAQATNSLKENTMATAALRPMQPAPRTAVIASADLSFRQRVRETLAGLR